MRKAKLHRKTKETDILVEINCDGSGKSDIDTGIGFLDHMIEQLAKHGFMDISVKAKGDLHIDGHHTCEDVALAMGEALSEALGDRKGINRFAESFVPMDETMSRVVVDFSGRPYVVWNVKFSCDQIGDMNTELFREWFFAFGQKSGANIHVENLYGINNHHIIESCFKALALSVRKAVSINDGYKNTVPSTKGVL